MGKNTEDIGIISAYGYALTKEFKGTEEEFVEMMAGVKDYYQEVQTRIPFELKGIRKRLDIR